MDASTDDGRLFRFESFELDVRSGELRRGKDRIRLQEQPFEVLCMMLERPGDLVTREELAKAMAEGTFSLNIQRWSCVRITAWLVNASSEIHLWTDVYERHLTDCLSVQADVAARIAGSLASELIPEQPIVRSAG